MKRGIQDVIEKYLAEIDADDYHRCRSWNNCFKTFSITEQSELHVLELAFYLASWGMYRGSSGLLQKNHLIHKGAVDIVFSTVNQRLKCNQTVEAHRGSIKTILSMKIELANHYRNIHFTKGAASKSISPTDTLLSKIILGTLGCVPAYDRYFIKGLKHMKMKHTSFNEFSLVELFNFIEKNKKEIEQVQKIIKSKTHEHYPFMKILDIYFCQISYGEELREKSDKNNVLQTNKRVDQHSRNLNYNV